MQIVVHQWAFPGSFNQLDLLPRQELVNDWFGYDIEPPAQFVLATDGEDLWFLARREAPAVPHPSAGPGAFHEELWKYDVAELFIASAEGSRYWEFNLSPKGAWWACPFAGARQQDKDIPCPAHVETQAFADGTSWCAMARIPLAELKGIDIRNCKLSATFILGTPEQVFLTTALDLNGEPDFHRPDDFSPPILK